MQTANLSMQLVETERGCSASERQRGAFSESTLVAPADRPWAAAGTALLPHWAHGRSAPCGTTGEDQRGSGQPADVVCRTASLNPAQDLRRSLPSVDRGFASRTYSRLLFTGVPSPDLVEEGTPAAGERVLQDGVGLPRRTDVRTGGISQRLTRRGLSGELKLLESSSSPREEGPTSSFASPSSSSSSSSPSSSLSFLCSQEARTTGDGGPGSPREVDVEAGIPQRVVFQDHLPWSGGQREFWSNISHCCAS